MRSPGLFYSGGDVTLFFTFFFKEVAHRATRSNNCSDWAHRVLYPPRERLLQTAIEGGQGRWLGAPRPPKQSPPQVSGKGWSKRTVKQKDSSFLGHLPLLVCILLLAQISVIPIRYKCIIANFFGPSLKSSFTSIAAPLYMATNPCPAGNSIPCPTE